MSFRIHIPKPCGEDWNAMQPTDRGRYCEVCAHEVPDLSRTPDEELAAMALRQEIPKCARFNKGQLDRAIAPQADPVLRLKTLVLAAAMITTPVLAAEPDSVKSDADTVAKKKVERRIRKKGGKKQKTVFSDLERTFESAEFRIDGLVIGDRVEPPVSYGGVICIGPEPQPTTWYGFPMIEPSLPQLSPGLPTMGVPCGVMPMESDRIQNSNEEVPSRREEERERERSNAHPALLAVFFRHQRIGQALRKLRATVFGMRLGC